jgi:hypothetical protein
MTVEYPHCQAMPSCPSSHVKELDQRSRALSRRRSRPSFAVAGLSDLREGAGKTGHRLVPMVRVQQKARGRTTGSAENTRPPPRNGFNGVFRALPGDHRLVATVIPGKLASQELSACFGAPGPHGLTVRARVSRLLPRSRPPHPASTFVTTRTPLFDEAGRRREYTISVFRKEKYLGVEDRQSRSD